MPFKPAPLSQLSAKLAPTPAGLDELYSDTRRVRALAAAELRYGKPCFAPDTRSSRHSRRALLNAEESAIALVPGPASSERLAKLLQDKEAHLGRLRQSIAEEEAKVHPPRCALQTPHPQPRPARKWAQHLLPPFPVDAAVQRVACVTTAPGCGGAACIPPTSHSA